ncbi:MFS transporter [Paraburkholderia caffeinilytica]|uniref:MFS transporter n=1 Tax=Paraburkholderia caffeinilytica TaxID=1761016 RepID=UPI0038BCF1A2
MQPDQQDLQYATSRALRRIVPFITLMFILSFLDRVNVSFAKAGLQQATGMSDAAFAFGLGLFFVGYALFETPSNIVMHRVGARVWLARIMITWGLACAATMFVTSTPLFYVMRSLLGIAEAGFFPGVLYYFTYWFPERVRAQAVGRLYYGLSLAFVIGGPVCGALLDLDGLGGLHGWQYMFLIEGLFTSIVGLAGLWYLIDRPADAKWLTPMQRLALEEELAREIRAYQQVPESSAWQLLLNAKVLYCSLIFFISGIGLYGVTFFLPSQIAQLMHRNMGFVSGLASAVPWICAFALTATIPRWSDRTGERRYTSAACIALGVFGILLAGGAFGPVGGFIGLCIATAGIVAAQPVYFALPASFLCGRDAAAGLGIITSAGSIGAFVAPNLRVWAEHYFNAHASGLYVISATLGLNVLLLLCLPFVGIGDARMRVNPDPLAR